MVRIFRSLVLMTMLVVAHVPALAGGPITWSVDQVTTADGRVQVLLKATCEQGWHIYALTLPRDDGPIPTSVRVNTSPDFRAGAVTEPEPEMAYDPNFGMELRFHSNTVAFVLPIERVAGSPFTVSGEVEFMACNDKTCLPPVAVPFSVTVPAP